MNIMSKQASSKVSDHFRQSRSGAGRAPFTRGKKADVPQPAAPLYQAAAIPAAAAEQQAGDAAADEATLRQFDLDSRFGPCTGITRLERWERAVSLGLNPPPEVAQLVRKHGEGSLFNKNVFAEDKPF